MKKLAIIIGKFFETPTNNPYSEIKTIAVDATIKEPTKVGEHLGINHAGKAHDNHWAGLKEDFRTISPNVSLFKY